MELSSFAVVFVEPSCSFTLHQSVLDLALLPERLYLLLGHTLLFVPVIVQAALSTFPAPRPVAALEYTHREALWKVLCVFLRALSVGDSSRDSFVPSQRGSDVF